MLKSTYDAQQAKVKVIKSVNATVSK
jgi:hypothetical protein